MMNSNATISDAIRAGKVLLLDGAMGTQLLALTGDLVRSVKGNNESLNLSHPELIRRIHQSYVDAGADIIETNSFGANAVVQADYGLAGEARKMALEAARIARGVADAAPREIWVAGSIGPTGKSLSLVADYARPEWRPLSFDEMASSYREQIEALLEGGVDLIQIETCFDALNAKAALYALEQVHPGFPAIVSVSVSNASGHTLTGQSLKAFYAAVASPNLMAFGLNCSMGAEGLVPIVKDLAAWCPSPIICYPNAGLPNARGEYDDTPESMARQMAGLDGLVNIIGGCCGTTPAHIKAMPRLQARPVPEADNSLTVSGLEAWTLSGDYEDSICHAANMELSPEFAAMMKAGEFEDAMYYVLDQMGENTAVLDINLDAMPDAPEAMERFVRLIQGTSRAALWINSADRETILAGEKNAQGKCYSTI